MKKFFAKLMLFWNEDRSLTFMLLLLLLFIFVFVPILAREEPAEFLLKLFIQ